MVGVRCLVFRGMDPGVPVLVLLLVFVLCFVPKLLWQINDVQRTQARLLIRSNILRADGEWKALKDSCAKLPTFSAV